MHCDSLPGPVLVIPPPRLLLSGGDGALGGRGGDCNVRGWGKFALGQCSQGSLFFHLRGRGGREVITKW